MTTKLAYKLSTLTALFLLISTTVVHAAATERVLYSADGVNVLQPYGLVADALGNLYGASIPNPYGAIFRLAKGPTGHWNMTLIYQFRGGTDGVGAAGPLSIDSAGNLYGTTTSGGTVRNCSCGTVFKLTPSTYLPWRKTTLYSFTGFIDGRLPYGGVVMDSSGNLFGAAWEGGTGNGCGAVYELSPTSGGGWSKSTLYSFQCGNDGYGPESSLALDRNGNIYGTTAFGGGNGCATGYGCGIVFELIPNSGAWSEKVLHAFTGGTDGAAPAFAGVVVDPSGNLYGTTEEGGELSGCGGVGCGLVFQLSPSSGGEWVENVLYAFSGTADGAYPYGTPTRDQAGRIYGVTFSGGGSSCSCGTVFELDKSSGGIWTETTLHSFDGSDGYGPEFALVMDKLGNLYGTTFGGGADNQGVVFKIFP